MRVRRQTIGLGFIGLFIMLLCAGSTWGSEAVSHEPNEPAQSTTRGDTTDRFDVSEGGIPVSFPSRSNTASGTFENPLELTYTDFSINSSEPQSEPVDWQTLSIIPELSDTAREILLDGIAKGNNPQAFSTIGDCQSFSPVFMGIFDQPGGYELASDEGYLQESITHFGGSFARESASVNNGFSVASVLSPLWADPEHCQPNENPLECEFRIHRPIVVFINLGTNWQPAGDLTREDYLRGIIGFAIDRGVLPILSTKGDNIEGNHRVNEGIANIASEYDIPLWNFRLSIQYLPQHGIDRDRGGNYLSVAAWNKRSYSWLRMLHLVYSELMKLQGAST
jgi:hypothetical protein